MMGYIINGLVGFLGVAVCIFQLISSKREKERDKREEAQRIESNTREADQLKLQLLFLKGIRANTALCEATAIALRDKRCNGETEQALNYALEIKHETRDYLEEQGLSNVF